MLLAKQNFLITCPWLVIKTKLTVCSLPYAYTVVLPKVMSRYEGFYNFLLSLSTRKCWKQFDKNPSWKIGKLINVLTSNAEISEIFFLNMQHETCTQFLASSALAINVRENKYYSTTNNNKVSKALHALLFASDNAFKHKIKNKKTSVKQAYKWAFPRCFLIAWFSRCPSMEQNCLSAQSKNVYLKSKFKKIIITKHLPSFWERIEEAYEDLWQQQQQLVRDVGNCGTIGE